MIQTIEEYYHSGFGYNPFLIRLAWQVAQLNYAPELALDAIHQVERHNETDEVFILFGGESVLITALEGRIETCRMKPAVTYNIPAGVWHAIAMRPEDVVLIVENSNTHLNDVEYRPLSRSELRGLADGRRDEKGKRQKAKGKKQKAKGKSEQDGFAVFNVSSKDISFEATNQSRREFLARTTAGLGGALLSENASGAGAKRVSVVIAALPDLVDFISWRLWDPYFLAVGIPQVQPLASRERCDLLILGERGGQSLKQFLDRLGRADGVIAAQPATRLENRHLRVEVSAETGSIVSLWDKSRNKELLRPGEHTRFLCSYPQIDTTKARAQVKLERADAVAQAIRVRGKLAECSYSLLLTLGHESPWLECELEVDYGPGAIFGYKMRAQTLLRAVFPCHAGGTRWVNQPFGVYETKVNNPVTLDFCDAFDGSSGVAVFTDGMPGLHLDAGSVGLLIADGFPPLRGAHRYRYAVYPHAGDWRGGDVLRKAHEFQEQLAAHPVPNGALPLPFERSYLETTSGPILSALYVRDGKMRARFYDGSGQAQQVETRWHIPWPDAWAAQLDGRLERQLPVDGARIQFDLPAWRIFTISQGAQS